MSLFLFLLILAAIVVFALNYSKIFIKDTFINFESKETFKNPNEIPNIDNPPLDNYNQLERKYYNLKNDCYWNNKCELPANNINFFEYKKKITKTPSLLSCNIDTNKMVNCTNNQYDGCFINKTCSCQKSNNFSKEVVTKTCIEPFIAPAINFSEDEVVSNIDNIIKFNPCKEGYSVKNGSCQPLCRGCVVGKCENAQCHS